MFFTYILKSEVDQTHYYGHSSNLLERLKKHNGGKVRSTKAKRPWKILYYEEFETKSEAYKREMFFKSIDGYRFLKDKGII
ncbi:GIY-YIG nuclease family protein [uncultured Imperialibacter sp.]|uniref:GIY-YIG nuclease family protein n=1 Tax=Imperialibacter sp. TaxID=2038411 RepID=UPI0030DA481A|tara:strand:+ start:12622 stop:12864 length:243 start_codon:yes stop_codon:yes gene_type:complete